MKLKYFKTENIHVFKRTLRVFYTDYFDLNNSISSDVPAHFCDVRVTLILAGRFSIDVVSTTAKC